MTFRILIYIIFVFFANCLLRR